MRGGLDSLINGSTDLVDRFFPAETRARWRERLTTFSSERPYLASFLLSQFVLSGTPLVVFAVLSVTVLVFALVAGILVGVIGALLFVAFALGFALLFLLPTLFVTTATAVFVWFWAVAIYSFVRWFHEKDNNPGVVHTAAGPDPAGKAVAIGGGDVSGGSSVEGTTPPSDSGEEDSEGPRHERHVQGS